MVSSIIVVAPPGSSQKTLVNDLTRLGLASNTFSPDTDIPTDMLAPSPLVIQSVCGNRYNNPFKLHEQLSHARFGGQLLLVGDTDHRVLEGLALNARAHRVNVVGALVRPYKLQQLLTLCNAGNKPTNGRPFLHLRPPSRAALIEAIEHNAIHPWYQPIIDSNTGQTRRAEVLARWVDNEGRAAFVPSQFIPMAEKTGLIDAILAPVALRAIEQLAPLIHMGRLCGLSINLSMTNLARPELADELVRHLTLHGLSPHHVTLEITETTIGTAAPTTLAVVSRLRLIGFPIAIDDFGTGISGLSHLSQLPFTELKIDRLFVKGVHLNTVNEAICRGAISMAQDLGMRVVAEGVETREEAEQMTSLGATAQQGYLYARPLHFDQLTNHLGQPL